MKCVVCGGKTYVKDVVRDHEHSEIYRKRRCIECDEVFYTVEMSIEYNDDVEEIWRKNYRKRRV